MKLKNESINRILRRAEKCKGTGNLAEATELYQQVLREYPKNLRAQKGLSAVAALATRNFPADPPAEKLAALRQLYESGQSERAMQFGRQLLQQTPNGPALNSYMGAIAFRRGDIANAAAFFKRAINSNPRDHEAFCNLGVCLQSQLQFDAALQCFNKAVLLKPDYATAYKNAGVVFKRMSKFSEAADCLKKAIELKPDYPEPHLELGLLYSDMGDGEAAAAQMQKHVALFPDSAIGFQILGQTQTFLGLHVQAKKSFETAAKLAPESFEHEFSAALVLAQIPGSVDEITAIRKRFSAGLSRLEKSIGRLEKPEIVTGSNCFLLSYYNSNNKEQLKRLGDLFRKLCPDLNFKKPVDDESEASAARIRVAICSEYLSGHTIGKLFGGIVSRLNRSKFDVTVIHAPKSLRDRHRDALDEQAGNSFVLPQGLRQQRELIVAQNFDVIFYPDIGMSSDTYYLAFSRLAPVQVLSWGHPETSGIDTLDYFVSSDRIEPPTNGNLYSERRILLSRLPCHYSLETGDVPSLDRSEFGLPESGTLYGCPQTLFKFHPDFDAVLAKIAEGDPDGHIVLIEGRTHSWIELLRKRWAEHNPILNQRVIFLPRQPRNRFLALLNLVDVLLDPIHFGSGNTLYEAMMFGTPIVTWPGQFMRGRIVAGAYRQMGVEDAPVAPTIEDYAPLALALGRDAERRHKLRETLKEAARRDLFEDESAVRELEAFFEAAVASARRGEKLPDGWSPKPSAKEVQ